jgi:hypothetical protein
MRPEFLGALAEFWCDLGQPDRRLDGFHLAQKKGRRLWKA